jgi:hypothetical protein
MQDESTEAKHEWIRLLDTPYSETTSFWFLMRVAELS